MVWTNRDGINWLVRVVAPLFVGIAIYVTLRDSNALALGWLRPSARNSIAGAPDWCSGNLPDGLWVFSFTSAIRLIWGRNRAPETSLWTVTPLALGIGLEALQYLKLVSGTADWLDMGAYTIGFVVAVLLPVPRRRGIGSCAPLATSHPA